MAGEKRSAPSLSEGGATKKAKVVEEAINDGHRPQDFSLPSNIIYYMAKNPSTPLVYEKLVQSCKYFFFKNPIIVTIGIIYKENEFWITNTINSNPLPGNRYELENGIELIEEDDGIYIVGEDNPPPLRLSDIKVKDIPYKLWLDGDLELSGCNKEEIAYLMEKVARWDLNELMLIEVDISHDDYQKMVSTENLKTLYLESSSIDGLNGEIVPLNKLIEGLKNLSNLEINVDRSFFSSETIKNLLKLPCFKNLDTFNIAFLPETFDIETFAKFVKKHRNAKFGLNFVDNISAPTKTRIENVTKSLTKILKKEHFNVHF